MHRELIFKFMEHETNSLDYVEIDHRFPTWTFAIEGLLGIINLELFL